MALDMPVESLRLGGGRSEKKKQGKKNLPDLKLHPFSVSLFHTPSGKKINSQLLDF
jgi:hypothetical protein